MLIVGSVTICGYTGRITCWSTGWRGFGDDSGTDQCPANKIYRGNDNELMKSTPQNEEACCRLTCGSSNFTEDSCPAGSEFRHEWHECESGEARALGGTCTAGDCCRGKCSSLFPDDAACPDEFSTKAPATRRLKYCRTLDN